MRAILLSALALGAMTSTALANAAPPSAPGPITLTDQQMDALTAGLAGVGISANAFATGDRTFTRTHTDTRAFSRGPLDLAIGRGSAFATGSESHDVEMGVLLIHDGDPLAARAVIVERDTPLFSFGIAFGIVVDR